MNDRTDLHLAYEPVKTGRKLTHLHFTITGQAWQLQLFEAEHAARLVAELAKTFDGPILESKATPAEADPASDRAKAALIDECVKLGVTSATVERALKKHGVEGVGEIIAQTKKRWEKMDAKGESYDRADYLAGMLNKGAGVKSPAAREKAAKARQAAAERKAAHEAKTAAEAAEEALKNRFGEYQRQRATEIIARQSAATLAELGDDIAEQLSYRAFSVRWNELGRQVAKLDKRKGNDKVIWGGYIVPEVLKRWGDPADTDIEIFHQLEAEAA